MFHDKLQENLFLSYKITAQLGKVFDRDERNYSRMYSFPDNNSEQNIIVKIINVTQQYYKH